MNSSNLETGNPHILMSLRDGAQELRNLSAARSRDLTIDVLRGLAIVTMVAANLAAPALEEPHPFWLRVYGSFAAPLFVLLSGMMVAGTSRRRGYGLVHFLSRAAVVVTVAALLEMLVWHFYPFMSVDVLYLIGISLPLAHASLRLSDRARWGVILTILLLTPALQLVFGYADYPTEVALGKDLSHVPVMPIELARHWLLDGWFPLFPWSAFSLLGVQLAGLRSRETVSDPARIRQWGFAGLGILAVGVALWWLHPGPLMTRAGYSELFYPPMPGFVVTAIGLIVLLFAVIDLRPNLTFYQPLRLLGESAMLMYLVHIVLIRYLIEPDWSEESPETFARLYIGLLAALFVAAWIGRAIKAGWNRPPFAIRVLLGA